MNHTQHIGPASASKHAVSSLKAWPSALLVSALLACSTHADGSPYIENGVDETTAGRGAADASAASREQMSAEPRAASTTVGSGQADDPAEMAAAGSPAASDPKPAAVASDTAGQPADANGGDPTAMANATAGASGGGSGAAGAGAEAGHGVSMGLEAGNEAPGATGRAASAGSASAGSAGMAAASADTAGASAADGGAAGTGNIFGINIPGLTLPNPPPLNPDLTAAPIRCASAADCSTTSAIILELTPICDAATSTCVTCPTKQQHDALATRVLECMSAKLLSGCADEACLVTCRMSCE